MVIRIAICELECLLTVMISILRTFSISTTPPLPSPLNPAIADKRAGAAIFIDSLSYFLGLFSIVIVRVDRSIVTDVIVWLFGCYCVEIP